MISNYMTALTEKKYQANSVKMKKTIELFEQNI